MSSRIQIEGVAQEHDQTAVGLVAEGADRSALLSRDGRLFVADHHPYSFHTSLSYAAATTAAAPIVSAPTTGTSIYITDIIFAADTGGAMTLLEQVTAGSINLVHGLIPPGGGVYQHSFKNPIRASSADTTTSVVNLGLTTAMTTSTAVISGFFAP